MPNICSYHAFFEKLCSELISDGVEVHVACSFKVLWSDPAAGPGRPDGKLPVMHCLASARGMNPLEHWRAARELDLLVRKLQPDLVHSHFHAAIFTTALARSGGWPATLATFHGLPFSVMSGFTARLVRSATVWAIRRFNSICVLNEECLRCLQEAVPDAVFEPISEMGVGCDLERFGPVDMVMREQVRGELGLRRDDRVFVFIGRLTEFKGFALTVRAFELLAQEDPSARLLLVGTRDPLHATGLTPEEEVALEASSRIVQTGYRTDVHRLLGASDVVVFPSRREGMPVCLMEALAMGIPVITRDVAGCRDVVRHGVDGLVLAECTAQNLCLAMWELGEVSGLYERFSAAALAGRGRFNRSNYVRDQKAIYRRFFSSAASNSDQRVAGVDCA